MATRVDDVTDNMADAGKLAIGATFAGKIGVINDHDWFKVTLQSGLLYSATLASPKGGTPAGFAVTLHDANGKMVPWPQYWGMDGSAPSVSGVPTTGGDYYVCVTSPAATGDYQLTVAQTADDYTASSATKGSLPVGGSVNGTINIDNDRDWFRIKLDAGASYSFITSVAAGRQPPVVRVYDENGAAIGDTYDYDVFQAPHSGYYYVEAEGYGTGLAYTLAARAIQDDFGNTDAAAAPMAPGATITGKLNYRGDTDKFRIELQEGAIYTLTFNLPPEPFEYGIDIGDMFGSPWLIKMLDTTGFNTPERTAKFKAISGGTLYVSAKSFDSSSASGQYRIGLTVDGAIDQGDTEATAITLRLGATVSADLHSAFDSDVFKLSLQAGITYTVRGAGELATAGKLKVESLPGHNGSDTTISITPETSGDYYVIVHGASSGQGAYTLQADYLQDDYSANPATTGKLAIGGQISGTIGASYDRDWIAATLEGGKSYWIQTTLTGDMAQRNDATLSIVDSGNNVLARFSGLQPDASTHAFTPSASGTYYFQMERGASTGWQSGAITSTHLQYIMSVKEGTDDRPLPSALALGTTVSGQLEIPTDTDAFLLNLQSEHYYQVDLRLSNQGAISAEPINYVTLSRDGNTRTFEPMSGANGLVIKMLGSGTHTLSLRDADGLYNAYNLRVRDLGAAATKPGPENSLYIRASASYIDGGAGVDSLLYKWKPDAYQISNGGQTIKWAGSALTDTLNGIERLIFTDSTDAIALDVDGAAGHAYRLYQAAFNRSPDKTGVGYWINVMDQGASLHDVAQSFIDSAEFKTLYGASPTDAQFVDSLYWNVLHRAGESAGVDYWLDVLKQGIQRADVLASFSESKENIEAVARIIGNGFEYTPYG